MTEREFLEVLSTVRPIDGARILDVPVAHTSLDSFDLLTFRAALETRLDTRISDEVWMGARSLRELLNALP